MSGNGKMTVTAKVQQAGEYGIARPDEPIEVDARLGKKLIQRGNFVEGLTPRAQVRVDAAKAAEAEAAEKAKAEAEAAEKAKADADAKAKAEAEEKAKPDAAEKAKGKV